MVTPTPRPERAASALTLAAAVLAALSARASGQTLYDPYQTFSAPYYNYTTPSLPTNFALPNAAREAGEYEANAGGYGVSRYNTFDRWLGGADADPFSSRSRGSRRADPYRDRAVYVPNQEADRKFYDYEAKRADRALERDRLYRLAARETDPVKRAKLLRELARVAEGRPAPRAGAATPAPTRGATAAPRRGSAAAPAPSSTPRPGANRPSGTAAGTAPAASTPRATPPARRSETLVPLDRPPLPSEIGERRRDSDRSTGAPPPPPGTGTVIEPSPIPDDLPLPPPR